MTPDAELLRQYAEESSEAAFTELVERYLNLVYSVALRVAGGDAHLAQDAAQLVFTDLARKARALSRRAMLAGWLHTSARFAASKLVRAEHRRRIREQEAPAMPDIEHPSEETWVQLRPILDEAVGQLPDRDREAVLLRYFEGKEFKDVGAVLGVNENAARLRVDRALERLRRALTRRGVSLSSSALAAMLASQAVTSAPAGLALGLTHTALAGAAAGTGITLTLVNLMNGTGFKLAAAGTLIICGLGTGMLLQHQALIKLRGEHDALMERVRQLDLLGQENARLSKLQIDEGERARLRKEHEDLLRLRAEITRLRQQLRAGQEASAPVASTEAAPEPISPVNSFVASIRSSVADKGTLVVGGWTTKPGRRTLVFISPQSSGAEVPAGQGLITASFVEAPDAVWDSVGLGAMKASAKESSLQQALGSQEWPSLLKTLRERPGVDVLSAPRVQTADGTQASITAGDDRDIPGSDKPVYLGVSVDLLPHLSDDHANIDLTIKAQYTTLNEPKP